MRTKLRTLSIGLSGLALGAGVLAQAAAPVITNITMVGVAPQFAVRSDLSITNQIQYCTNLSQTNWVVLTNLLVAQSPYWFVDTAAPSDSQRFYRVAALATGTPPPAGMALIPAGSFTMGNCMATNEGDSAELPLHTVYVSAFYMDTNLVTSNLWLTVKAWNGGNGYSYDNVGSGRANGHPVQTVSWYDSVKWCNARSQMEGLTPCYYTDEGLTAVYKAGQLAPYVNWGASGYRLPTEAEWERAARGGLGGHRFPWGDTISWSQANYYAWPAGYAYDVNPAEGFHPAFNDRVWPLTSRVGYFGANGYGLYDMAANLWQWCWDWYGLYGSAPQADPRGPSTGSYRVFRGGSWYRNALYCRTAGRGNGASPSDRFYDLGFRCARAPGQ
jgi:formylglycine-generating enzyme